MHLQTAVKPQLRWQAVLGGLWLVCLGRRCLHRLDGLLEGFDSSQYLFQGFGRQPLSQQHLCKYSYNLKFTCVILFMLLVKHRSPPESKSYG